MFLNQNMKSYEEKTIKEQHCLFNKDDIFQDSSGCLTPGIYYPKNKILHRKTHHHKKRPRLTKRIVFRNGDFNIDSGTKNNFYIKDVFVTLVEARWRWTLLGFCIAFIFDWLFYGTVYWFIALYHGDLEEDHLPLYQNATNWVPCVENIYGFTSSFLFSIEVHTTVAYGSRAITLECPAAIITMCFQCILSSIFQAFMVGILFVKLTRPKARTQTILFSKNIVIYMRDDIMCLAFRVGDIRSSRILNIKAMAYLIYTYNSVECIENNEQVELKTELDGNESAFFLWPLTVVHIIDESSPLHKFSAADLLCGRIEILVVFEGMIETTGQPVQARSSYTENDILWGHRFDSMVYYDTAKDLFSVDFSKLNTTEQIDTPLCSFAEYKNIVSILDEETI